jgi:tRNA(Ile)-lysidine synthetase-like protein
VTRVVKKNSGAARCGDVTAALLHVIEASGLLRAGERVGVAVSGGADSVALLLLLRELRVSLGLTIYVLHFNHKLRGRAADADEKFVAALGKKLALPFYAGAADVKAIAKRDKANTEDAARRERYVFFARATGEHELDKVAVAHTADDQAETVLAHILRGSGITGLGGIHPQVGKSGAATAGGAAGGFAGVSEIEEAELAGRRFQSRHGEDASADSEEPAAAAGETISAAER